MEESFIFLLALMYPFNMKLETTKKSSGTNKIRGIVDKWI